MPVKFLMTKAGDIRIADAATNSILTDGEGGPPLVVPAATVKAAAMKLGLGPVVEAAPGTEPWVAGLDPDARASFDRCLAAGVGREDASNVAMATAAHRPAFERMAVDSAKAKAAAALAEQQRAEDERRAAAEAKEREITASADSWLASDEVRSKVTPAVQDNLKSLYLTAARADATAPPKDGEPGQLDAVKSLVSNLGPHPFTGQRTTAAPLPPAGARPLPNGPEANNAQARNFELLAETPDGRAALARIPEGKAWLDARGIKPAASPSAA